MEINLTGKHVEITGAIKALIEEKVSRLPRFYDSLRVADILLDGSDGGQTSVEVIARAEHNRVFVAKNAGPDMYACIDDVIKKIERQITKHKEKERDNKHIRIENDQ